MIPADDRTGQTVQLVDGAAAVWTINVSVAKDTITLQEQRCQAFIEDDDR
jgi:hypothetical protein